ncbi:MAG: type VI secretion system baseplate subunit TssF, partial [Deltaproteobacteria bacterium]|nr:type VI secretion system baseplate subunit TssF [Deltaproteobacteria bacterium]
MKAKSEEILEYYKRELAYLRRMGTAFAEQYPKVAGRLELGIDQCPDPHIERLIEAFAFLTARIQFNIESEFPQISTAFLGILYPHFLNPTPSMGVARLEVDPDQGKLTTGHLIPKHTQLFTQSLQGQNCRFRT